MFIHPAAAPSCPPTDTIVVTGSTETEMDANGVCCCCGQPQWFELAGAHDRLQALGLAGLCSHTGGAVLQS